MNREKTIEALVEELSPDQSARLVERLDELEAVGAPSRKENKGASSRSHVVAAYVVPRAGASPSEAELRSSLSKVLPDYMVPSRFAFVDELPTTPTGKVDRKRLPALTLARPTSTTRSSQPESDAEKTLTRIWTEVLGFDDVGAQDDFFEMGGDSLLSIRILARARQAGIVVSPKAFFDQPTVAGMVAAARTATPASVSTEGASGRVPLTPIQHWFFERKFPNPHHWNQAVVLEVPGRYLAATIRSALEALVTHHDALRMSFERVDRDGSWGANVLEDMDGPNLVIEEMTGLAETEQRAVIDRIATDLHRSFDLGAGGLIRAALFGTGEVRRLLLVVHHLVIDGLSWSILLEHFEQACRQLGAAEPVELPTAVSFRGWALALDAYAQSDSLDSERAFWLARTGTAEHRLPLDGSGRRDENYVEDQADLVVRLSEDETRRLLHEAPRAYHMQVNEIVLAALARTLARWVERSSIRIDLEGHGREDVESGLDVSATIGWFTSVFPARFDLPIEMSNEAILKSVKEQLRAIPRAGVGYGVLRYLHPDERTRREMRDLPTSDLVFNYLGPKMADRSHGFPVAEGPSGEARSSKGLRPYLHEINASIDSGGLTATWSYSRRLSRRETIREIASSFIADLRALIEHCLTDNVGGHTPSDFPLANVDQSELDRIAGLLDDDG